MRPIDLPPADLETVRRILRKHAPGLEARAFGSRVSWTARKTSDLDLVLMTETPLDAGRMAALRAALAGSDLPFRVDVADWAAVSEDFRAIIEREYAPISPADTRPAKRLWKRSTLDDCIEINDDTYSPRERRPFVNYLDTGSITENRIAKIQHLVDGRDKIPTRARRKARQGDIVYSTVRPNRRHYGVLRDIPENFLASTGFSVLRGRKGVAFTDFIYWFLARNETVQYLQSVAEQSKAAYPAINPVDIEQLPIDLPPLAEQRAIADVLGALDDKIELNRRMNETLEAMARAIFDDWFVDFGPARARTEEREPYLAPEVWRLFPDSLSEANGIEAPTGWRMAALPELVEINPKRQLKKGQMAPYLDMAHMPTEGHAPSHIPGRPTGSGTRFANGDTLLARIAPCLENGKTAYVDFLPTDGVGWGSTEYIVLRPRPPLPDEFAYCLARNSRFREFAIQSMTGTSGRQRAPAAALSKFVLPVPPTPVAAAFGRVVRPLLARAGEAVRESHALADARDALLPRLMSGRLRLGDAEKAAA